MKRLLGKLVVLGFLLIVVNSCAGLEPIRVKHVGAKAPLVTKETTFSEKFIKCVRELNKDGFRAENILLLCDKAYKRN